MERTAKVIGVDTNVLLRFFVDSDANQSALAKRVLLEKTADQPLYISSVTLAEFVWVLRKSMRFGNLKIIELLRDLLSTDEVIIENADELGQALSSMEMSSGDVADHLISFSNSKAGCVYTLTFDKKAAKLIPDMKLLT